MTESPSGHDVLSVNGVQQCVTISCHSFVFGQSLAKVSAGFTNVSGLAVAAFDPVFYSLPVLRFVFVLDISKWPS